MSVMWSLSAALAAGNGRRGRRPRRPCLSACGAWVCACALSLLPTVYAMKCTIYL